MKIQKLQNLTNTIESLQTNQTNQLNSVVFKNILWKVQNNDFKTINSNISKNFKDQVDDYFTKINSKGEHALLIKAHDFDGKVISDNPNSDTITLLMRDGPMFKDSPQEFSQPTDPYPGIQSLFNPDKNDKRFYHHKNSLFDSKMSDYILKTHVVMVNQEQFNINSKDFYQSIKKPYSILNKDIETARTNLNNILNLKNAIELLVDKYTDKNGKLTKKINLIAWSYGSLVANSMLALFPKIIDNLNKIAIVGTILSPKNHTFPKQSFLFDNNIYYNSASYRNRIFFSFLNTIIFEYFDFLDNPLYVGTSFGGQKVSFGTGNEYILSSKKIGIFQNQYDDNISPFSKLEISKYASKWVDSSNLFLDNVDWKKSKNVLNGDNIINHYSFRDFNQQGEKLLKFLDYI